MSFLKHLIIVNTSLAIFQMKIISVFYHTCFFLYYYFSGVGGDVRLPWEKNHFWIYLFDFCFALFTLWHGMQPILMAMSWQEMNETGLALKKQADRISSTYKRQWEQKKWVHVWKHQSMTEVYPARIYHLKFPLTF